MSENVYNTPKKILIIDDQPFMIKLIEYNLKKHGYNTVTEVDGLKALEEIDEILPDLVLLDIRMPKITGTELCRRFRQKESMKDVPIIILTGQVEVDTEIHSRESGATDFMTKPFSPVELSLKVKEYI
jgi:two-component system alkaline phosphatase synthesis response regulator PhoP